MKTKKLFTLIAACLLIITIACGEKPILAAAIAVNNGVDVKRELVSGGFISPEDGRKASEVFLKIADSLLFVTNETECFESFTPELKERLLNKLNDALTLANSLTEVSINDSKKKQRWSLVVKGMKTSISALKLTVWLIPARDPLNAKEKKQLEDARDICRRAGLKLREARTKLLEDLQSLN